ncbi:hypothetical protein JVU11DRAFT_6227 [Chiua virens]|nr:hypothetical protein JVU11DRAFT_6227 [Chiua virens]
MQFLMSSRIISRFNHTPVIDSLDPVSQSSPSITPSNHAQLTVVVVVLVVVGLSAALAVRPSFCFLAPLILSSDQIILVLVRYWMRRAAIKRRRQASWILRSGHWNMEPKRSDPYDTRTGCSDASSSFAAYPYLVSERLDK